MYTILISQNKTPYDVSSIVYNMSWNDSIETLGVELSFTTPKVLSFQNFEINVKDKIKVFNKSTGQEIFRGIIISKDIGKHELNFTCFDYAFYLNQSKLIYQIDNISVSECIKQLANKFNVPIYKIENIPTVSTEIYTDKTVAEIIKDLLEKATMETGKKYRFEMNYGKLHVLAYERIEVFASVELANNLNPLPFTKTIDNISKSENISDLKNSIVVVENEKVLATALSQESIDELGLLQEIISVDEKDRAKAGQTAKITLQELNRVNESISIDGLGSDNLRAGRIINIVSLQYNLNGYYLIKSSTHSYNNNIHRVTLDLEAEPKALDYEISLTEVSQTQSNKSIYKKPKPVVEAVIVNGLELSVD